MTLQCAIVCLSCCNGNAHTATCKSQAVAISRSTHWAWMDQALVCSLQLTDLLNGTHQWYVDVMQGAECNNQQLQGTGGEKMFEVNAKSVRCLV